MSAPGLRLVELRSEEDIQAACSHEKMAVKKYVHWVAQNVLEPAPEESTRLAVTTTVVLDEKWSVEAVDVI